MLDVHLFDLGTTTVILLLCQSSVFVIYLMCGVQVIQSFEYGKGITVPLNKEVK